jgi:hypothetical protein
MPSQHRPPRNGSPRPASLSSAQRLLFGWLWSKREPGTGREEACERADAEVATLAARSAELFALR